MTIFRNSPDEWQRLDWAILQNGWTSLYWRNEILENDLDWFKKETYNIVDFNCKLWTDEIEMHRQLKQKLNFPDYYGENYDALNDCLSDLEILDEGLLITFRHLDSIDIKTIHILLDVFANNARRQLLFGKRIIILAQVDNPNFKIDPIGATPVMWNGQEWLDSTRL